MPNSVKTYVVERSGEDAIEIQADRGEQDSRTTRVTFYTGSEVVASFLNVTGWYPKAS